MDEYPILIRRNRSVTTDFTYPPRGPGYTSTGSVPPTTLRGLFLPSDPLSKRILLCVLSILHLTGTSSLRPSKQESVLTFPVQPVPEGDLLPRTLLKRWYSDNILSSSILGDPWNLGEGDRGYQSLRYSQYPGSGRGKRSHSTCTICGTVPCSTLHPSGRGEWTGWGDGVRSRGLTGVGHGKERTKRGSGRVG